MMWKMPASRMRSLASLERKSRLPVTIAAAIAPSSPPMIALTRERQAVARLIDRGIEALRARSPRAAAASADRPERRADRADAREKGVAGEIVAAGQRRARGRQQARLERDVIARCDVGRIAGRHAHAARRVLARHAVGVDDADHHARADGPQVDFLDKALQRDDADTVEHRRGDARGAQRHRQEACEQRGDREREAEREGPCAADPRKRAEGGDHQAPAATATGSRSAARLSATPPIAATGIQRKNRRSSTSRAERLANAPRQSGAHAAARVRPAAADRAPVRAGVAIGGETNARMTLGKPADRLRRAEAEVRIARRLQPVDCADASLSAEKSQNPSRRW